MYKHIRYDIISPDGFSFFRDVLKEAPKKPKNCVERLIFTRYGRQGYYSSNKGRLTLDEAVENCRVVKKEFLVLDIPAEELFIKVPVTDVKEYTNEECYEDIGDDNYLLPISALKSYSEIETIS